MTRLSHQRVFDIAQNLAAPMLGRLVSVKALKECQLWEGGQLHSTFTFTGRLLLGEVLEAALMLQACDDRTDNEEAYLDAMRATVREALIPITEGHA